MKDKKRLTIIKYNYLFIVLAVILLGLSGIIGYSFGLRTEEGKRQTGEINRIALPASPTLDPLMDRWKTYTDVTHGFSFKYPPNWTYTSKGGVPNNSALVFIVNDGNPKKDPIHIVISIKTNPDNQDWTPEQWFAYIMKWNNDPDLRYIHITVGGYPAIKNTQTIAFEEYNIIAPIRNLTAQNADYIIYFSNIGEGLNNPYTLTDPFLQHAYLDFERVISSVSFTK